MDINKLDDAVNDIIDVILDAESDNLINVNTVDKLINTLLDVNNEIKDAA
jgi:hypothetical protein|tara:strand:- start:450 stop:599 length:150 start_codon:yes stop_codon:yes gene_type:complete